MIADWEACYTLAVATAKKYYPRAAHLVATAAPTLLQPVLAQTGFTAIKRAPMTLQDNRSVLKPGYVPVLNMMDSDAAYLL